MEKITKVHPKDNTGAGAANPRLQCSRCAKWKRFMGRKIENGRQVAKYYFVNLSEEDIKRTGYQELCVSCYNEIIDPAYEG